MYVLGLDVGTQGARALVCDEAGNVAAQASEAFKPSKILDQPSGYVEQHPADWWEASSSCLEKLVRELALAGISSKAITAISASSTSGTVVPLDETGIPLRPAIMYNDTRADDEASQCNSVGKALTSKLGYKFASSFALPKILWIKKNQPKVFEKAFFAHPTDFIVGKLTGNFRISDTSNALKTGYDLVERTWPGFIEDELDIPISKLPQITDPGMTIGTVSMLCAEETGLTAGTPVTAGVTDGTAGFFASGASKVGDWNSTIGTTMVLRGVSKELIFDLQGRIYCHAHPQGYWLPGGASNAGAESIAKLFKNRELGMMNAYIPQYSPTALLVYPLVRKGERLPFSDPNVEGFIIGEPRDSRELYVAYLEGISFVERWCFDLMQELGAEVGDSVYVTGGGAKSVEWMQLRANIQNRAIIRPKHPDCAMGAAIVAASKTIFCNLGSAVIAMIEPAEIIEPDSKVIAPYEERYRNFRAACESKGYK